MRIVFFNETGEPGGSERCVSQLAKFMQREGHQILVLSLNDGWFLDELTRLGIPFLKLESKRRFDLGLAKKIKNVLIDFKADVLSSHLLDSYFYGAVGAKLAKVKHFGTEHGDVHHAEGKKRVKEKIWLADKLGTKFIAVSNFSAKKLVEFGAKKVVTIGNPIPEFFPKKELGRERLLEIDPKIKHDAFIWAHLANFRPVKDQPTLIKGFAKIKSYNSHLVIMGEGAQQAELEKLVTDLNIRSQVSFIGFRNDALELLAGCDGLVLSSLSEALPMTLLEGAKVGLILVSSDVGGVRDIFKSRNEWLFPAGDAEKLGLCLKYILDDLEGAKKTAMILQGEVLNQYSSRVIVDKYLNLFQS